MWSEFVSLDISTRATLPSSVCPPGRVPPSSSSWPSPNWTFAILASLPWLFEWLNRCHPVGYSSKTSSPERVSMTTALSRVGSFHFSFEDRFVVFPFVGLSPDWILWCMWWFTFFCGHCYSMSSVKAGTTSFHSHCSPMMVSSPRSNESFEKESKQGKWEKESACSRVPINGTAGTET